MPTPTTDTLEVLDPVLTAIRTFRFTPGSERQLHDAIETVLTDAELTHPVEREVALGPRERIDLLVGPLGIELKTAGATPLVARQLQRYAHHPRVGHLLLDTTVTAHRALPDQLAGVPVTVETLTGGGL